MPEEINLKIKMYIAFVACVLLTILTKLGYFHSVELNHHIIFFIGYLLLCCAWLVVIMYGLIEGNILLFIGSIALLMFICL